MKAYTKTVLVFLISLGFYTLNAQHYSTLGSTYDHLSEVNKEWAKHQYMDSTESIAFHSENDRIRFHLKTTIDYLSKNTSGLRSVESQKKRLALLEMLDHYADQKVFPKNIHHANRRPYFIDHEGTHCAVGYLMAVSGSSQLAKKIKQEHNYDYIRDIKTKGVVEWAKQNGFSLDELALIQPGYPATSIFSAIANGTNGPVASMAKDDFHNQIIFAGQFDTLDDLPCLNIGIYKEEQLSCLGEGIEGVINDVFVDLETEKIVATGALIRSGITYPMAIWNDGIWFFYNIPSREGATCLTSYTSYNYYSKELAISHPSIPNQQEIWLLKATGQWEKKATIDGHVFDIEHALGGRVYAGHFNTVTVHRSEGGDTSFVAHNVVMRENHIDNWFSIDSELGVSDTIKVIKTAGAANYFGGTCHSATEGQENNVCLSRYLNGVFQPVILDNNFSSFSDDNTSYTINAIELKDNKLLIGGDFSINPFVGTFGKNYAEYDLIFNSLRPLDYVNAPINTIVYWKNDIFIGGDFTTTSSASNASHLARTNFPTSTETIIDQGNLRLFPNPAKDVLNVEGLQSSFDYEIIDIKGAVVQKGTASTPNIELNSMVSGVYIINIMAETKSYRLKFVKQ